jgi:hypothetical protein
MRFKVSRAGGWYAGSPKEPPCAGAVLEEIDDGADMAWFIELETLEDLVQLCETLGFDIILRRDPLELVVYDDYVE